MLDSIKAELSAGISRYWVNVHTGDVFYLSQHSPMRLVDKQPFRELLAEGFIVLFQTNWEVQEYVAKTLFEELQAEKALEGSVIRWLTN